MKTVPRKLSPLYDDLCAGVGPALHDDAAVVETIVRSSLANCDHQEGFVECGLRSLANARQTNDYVDADVVIEQLQRRLEVALKRAKSDAPSIYVNPNSE